MIVKRNGDKVILKGGKVSCSCCGACCPERLTNSPGKGGMKTGNSAIRNALIVIGDYNWRSRFPGQIWPSYEERTTSVHFYPLCCRAYQYNRLSSGNYSLIKKTRPITTEPGYIVVEEVVNHFYNFSNSEIDVACTAFGVDTTSLGIITINVLWGRYLIRQNPNPSILLGTEQDSIGGIQCVKFSPS